MNNLDVKHTRQPGTYFEALRDYFERIQDNLEEFRKAPTLVQIGEAAEKGKACFCNNAPCENACPLGKPIPTINAMLKTIDIEALRKEFGQLMKRLDADIADYLDKPADKYEAAVREGYIAEINRIIEEKPELFTELKKLKKAHELQFGPSMFAEFTGKLCPAPCEGSGIDTGCVVRAAGAEPVSIKLIEHLLSDIGYAFGWTDEIALKRKTQDQIDKPVIIGGAGISGLSAAHALYQQGYTDITVIDAHDEIGGLIYRGIPDSKQSKASLAYYHYLMGKMGIKFELGRKLESVQDVKTDDNLVIIATGIADTEREPTWVPGYDQVKDRLKQGMEFLSEYQESVAQGTPLKEAEKKRVLVYGKGDTAADVVSTFTHKGEEKEPSNIILFQADRDLPYPKDGPRAGSGFYVGPPEIKYPRDVKAEDSERLGFSALYSCTVEKFEPVEEKGVRVHFHFFSQTNPTVARSLRGRQDDSIVDAECGAIMEGDKWVGVRMRNAKGELQDFDIDEDGRVSHTPNKELRENADIRSSFYIDFDEVVLALGFNGPNQSPLLKASGIDPKQIKNNRAKEPGIYVAGSVNPQPVSTRPDYADLLVNAARGGQEAAQAATDDIRAARSREMDWEKQRDVRPRTPSLNQAGYGKVGRPV